MHYTNIEGNVAVQFFDGVCWSHEPGHAPHIIQVRKSLEQQGSRVFLSPQIHVGVISVAVEGEIRNYYNHHADVIYNLEHLHQTSVCTLIDRYGILLMKVKSAEGYAFSVSKSPISVCLNS